jgi:hypothetical protein
MPKNTASEDPLVSKITQKEITREIMPNPGEEKIQKRKYSELNALHFG